MKYHFCKIQVYKSDFYRITSECKNIVIRNIRTEQDKVSFEISRNDFPVFFPYMDRERLPILERKDFGLFSFFTKHKLEIFFVSVAFTLLILFINSLYIWKISVLGNYSYTQEQILSYVKQIKYVEGMRKSEVDCEALENKIRSHYPNISWVSCEMKGTNLLIHLKENYIAEISASEKKPYHLLSNVSGTVVSIVTRKGTPAVKAGDKIKKGDLLVSGAVQTLDESGQGLFYTYTTADADIFMKVKHKYSDSIKKERLQLDYESRKNYYFPTVNSYVWHYEFMKNKYYENKEIKLKLYGNFYLPLSIQKTTVYEKEPETVKITEKEAENRLNNKMLYYFATLEQKGYKILEKNVRIVETDKKYQLKGYFTSIEPVGKIAYIPTEEMTQERETTTK